MKIAVYAIAKNEAKFARRWVHSMSEADEIFVLDTGSTDDTAAELEAAGATVGCAEIKPWRFDVARNLSLAEVSENADVCVCTDLDEVFEPGWRAALEKGWTDGAERGRYRYVWSHTPGGGDGVWFFAEKVHLRHGFKWVKPVHEVVVPEKGSCRTVTLSMTLRHFPDPEKSRASYLPLLETAVREDPGDDRSMHYLGREYMFRGRYDEAIAALKRHLAMPSATWADERAASMRYIARCCLKTGRRAEAERWLMRAVAEAPEMREPLVDYARLAYSERDWPGTVWLTGRALGIENRSNSYINEPEAWGPLPYDLRSIALFHLGDFAGAAEAVKNAITLETDEKELKRLSANLALILSRLS